MILGVIGTRVVEDTELVREIVAHYIHKYLPDRVVTGGAPGVDTLAESMARMVGIPVTVHRPRGHRWSDYRKRNIRIVEECDVLLVIRFKSSRTYGSGWTRDYAVRRGKRVICIEIEGC